MSALSAAFYISDVWMKRQKDKKQKKEEKLIQIKKTNREFDIVNF